MHKVNKQLSRRQFLRSGLTAGLTLFGGVGMVSGRCIAAAGPEPVVHEGMSVLLGALRSTGNVACLSAADRLEASQLSKTDHFDLQLRNAGLVATDAEIIAKAMRAASRRDGPALRSFSMSYNSGLTDAGVVALARAFPSTLTELGLVACAIGDEGGAALLRWGQRAVGLRMICVEGNRFSLRIRQGFTSLAQARKNLLVVV